MGAYRSQGEKSLRETGKQQSLTHQHNAIMQCPIAFLFLSFWVLSSFVCLLVCFLFGWLVGLV